MKTLALSLISLSAATDSLRHACRQKPANDLERDGVLQRFEFTFELAWKTIRKALIAVGRQDPPGSPRTLLRAAHQDGWIDDLPAWFTYLTARKLVSHIYQEKLAEEIHSKVPDFIPLVEGLIARLHTVVRDDSLG